MNKRLVGVLGTLALATTAVTVATPSSSALADRASDAPKDPQDLAAAITTPVPSETPFAALVAPSHPTQAPARPQPTVAPKVVVKPKPKPVAAPKPRTVSVRVPSVADARAYARSRVGATQFSCLDALWQKESSWNPRAFNSSSGAYGIPQALPGTKMATAGSDWRYNPITQVRWGLSYISGAYGTSCAAWRHSQAYNWY